MCWTGWAMLVVVPPSFFDATKPGDHHMKTAEQHSELSGAPALLTLALPLRLMSALGTSTLEVVRTRLPLTPRLGSSPASPCGARSAPAASDARALANTASFASAS